MPRQRPFKVPLSLYGNDAVPVRPYKVFTEVVSVSVSELVIIIPGNDLSGGFPNGNGGSVSYYGGGVRNDEVAAAAATALPEDADIRAVITVFEAAADFESDDEDITYASAAAAAPVPLAVPIPAPASVSAPVTSVAAFNPAVIVLLTRVAAAVEHLAVNVAAILIKLHAVAARARTGYDDEEEKRKEKK
ncbi:hypothetical protein DL768_010423 [Monosporascus sp. mg162]|nr:hypothetical protein DL768_010423 [Monosporascus sp. mg162]